MQNQNRHLAAILFTDIVGYTSMMQKDEQAAVALIQRHHSVMENTVSAHHGKVHSFYGDGCLCIFSSATEAVHCAIDVQQQLQTGLQVPLRIGLHIGEVFFEQGKVMGDGVNIASRIQSLGQANTILFSKEIFDKLRNQAGFQSVSLGLFEFKNVEEPMEVFALANKGLFIPKREQLEGKLKKNSSSKRKLIVSLAFLLFIAAAVFLYYQFFNKNDSTEKQKSVAIIPFKVIGTGQDALSDGLVEDILVRLSKIKELKVISNKSSVRYKDPKKSLKEIGEELNVSSLVMGTIQRAENRIRVSAQLIDCKTENTIWADNYDREIIQVFDLQTEVAVQIVNALQAKLTPEEKKNLSKRYTDNVEAYKLYRKGRAFWDTRTRESFDSAEANYKRAIQLDPDYALAYVGLADCYTNNQKGLSQVEAIPIARAYVNKALLLDSTLSEALTTKSFILGAFDYEAANFITMVKKAIRIDPNYPLAHIYYGNSFISLGKNQDKGIEENKKALELDPLSVSYAYILGRNYYLSDKLDDAYAQFKKTLNLDPKFNLAIANFAHVLLAKKNYSEAFKVISQLPKTGTSNLQEYQGSLLSYAYAVSGDKIRAKEELKKTLTEYPGQLSYHLARVYTILNDYDQALTRLEQGFKFRELSMVFLKVDPDFIPLRNEPRFKALIKKIDLE